MELRMAAQAASVVLVGLCTLVIARAADAIRRPQNMLTYSQPSCFMKPWRTETKSEMAKKGT